jgi:hypothetical protein
MYDYEVTKAMLRMRLASLDFSNIRHFFLRYFHADIRQHVYILRIISRFI